MRWYVDPPRIAGLAVRRELGRGGMGVVYLAADRRGREVAVKIVAARDPAPDARARFEREIAAVSAVDHPNVVRILGRGCTRGAPYAVFERVVGRDLTQVATPLPWRVVVHLGRQLARAVAAVHAAGFLHRDIKPSNVMVSARGAVTLIDFGLAQPCRSGRATAGTLERCGELTAAGAIAGTPRYLAPEVCAGDPATEQSDLFALGLVLLHLLGDAAACAPHALTDLIDQCLHEEPARRPQSASALADALDGLDGRPGPIPRARVVSRAAVGTTASTCSLALARTAAATPRAACRRRQRAGRHVHRRPAPLGRLCGARP